MCNEQRPGPPATRCVPVGDKRKQTVALMTMLVAVYTPSSPTMQLAAAGELRGPTWRRPRKTLREREGPGAGVGDGNKEGGEKPPVVRRRAESPPPRFARAAVSAWHRPGGLRATDTYCPQSRKPGAQNQGVSSLGAGRSLPPGSHMAIFPGSSQEKERGALWGPFEDTSPIPETSTRMSWSLS